MAADIIVKTRNKRKLVHVGEVYGKWTVIEAATPGSQRSRRWMCRCNCGRESVVAQHGLRRKTSTQCRWCSAKQNATTHGCSRHGPYRHEYFAWRGMITRCTLPTHPDFHNYGGRGISVCDHWKDFANFLADMGPRPTSRHSIDRYPNNDGNYEPSNVRWATRKEQAINTRRTKMVMWNGKLLCMLDLSRATGIPRTSLYRLLNRGMSVDDAIRSRALQCQT